MGIKQFSVMDLGKAGLIKPEQLGYKDSLEIIKDESFRIQKSFIKIGWYLKHIRDNELYKEEGYANICECAADQLGYSQSTVSRLINICEKFSKNHNSPEIDVKYQGFDKSQMIEMLSIEPEQLERITPDMTVKQIRDMKLEKKAEKEEPEKDIPGQTSIEKDFPEYMPEKEKQEEVGSDFYATSHKKEILVQSSLMDDGIQEKPDMVIDGEYREIEEPEPEGENIATSQPEEDTSHDEGWFIRQYVEIMSDEAAELFEICRKEQNNSDRAKAIQKHIAPYGYHHTGCSAYDFTFHGFAGGIDFIIGGEKMHLKYERFATELMKIMDDTEKKEEKAEDVPEKIDEPYRFEDDLTAAKYILEQEKKTLDGFLEVGNLPEMMVLRQKIIVAALADFFKKLQKKG